MTRIRRMLAPALVAPFVVLGACSPATTATPATGAAGEAAATATVAIDSAALMRDISVLAHDSMEGRRVGTPGGERARRFMERRFREVGLQPAAGGTFLHPFPVTRGETQSEGVNIVGMVRGRTSPDEYIVVTAHYDHLGVRNGEIYNGADDNASGSAALMQLARFFVQHAPERSMIFAALDAEEGGLTGARAFVSNPPVPLEAIVLNINMDMVGRNDAGELYVAGTHHYPALLPFVQQAAQSAEVTLIPGHDTPNPARPSDDWTRASDHGPFHDAGIPFLYFGVEDHPAYHQPTDDFSGIQPGFYPRAVRTVLSVVRLLDAGM